MPLPPVDGWIIDVGVGLVGLGCVPRQRSTGRILRFANRETLRVRVDDGAKKIGQKQPNIAGLERAINAGSIFCEAHQSQTQKLCCWFMVYFKRAEFWHRTGFW